MRWDGDEPAILDAGWLWSPAERAEDMQVFADVARIVCEADGSTSAPTPEVVPLRDGVHVVVDNRLDESASLNGLGFDVEPGMSEWTLQIGPGDHALACWRFSDHGGGDEPDTVSLRILDPEGLYVAPFELECPSDEQWSEISDVARPTSGIAHDPVEAVRRSSTDLEPGDVVSEHRSGYPQADVEGTTVTRSRDGRVVAIFSLSLAGDDRWLINGGRGCANIGIS